MSDILFLGGPNHGKTLPVPGHLRVVKTAAPRTSGIDLIESTYSRGTFAFESPGQPPVYVDAFVQGGLSSEEARVCVAREHPELLKLVRK